MLEHNQLLQTLLSLASDSFYLYVLYSEILSNILKECFVFF